MRTIVISLIALLAASCGESVPDVSSGNVTFFNESSYSVSVSLGDFKGFLIVDTLTSGGSYTTNVSTSDNHGIGSMFSIRYFFCAGGNACTAGIDPEGQIQQNIEAGKSYEIQIPNSSNIEWEDSFLTIQNASDMPFQLNRISVMLRQASNDEFSVPAGETGIYRIRKVGGTFYGLEIKDCSIVLVLGTTIPFPDFTAQNGYIYNFRFDGNEVEHLWDEEI